MDEIQRQWDLGYHEGWNEQGVLPAAEPTTPPLPNIPSDISDRESWAYKEGKIKGGIDRTQRQAGLF